MEIGRMFYVICTKFETILRYFEQFSNTVIKYPTYQFPLY